MSLKNEKHTHNMNIVKITLAKVLKMLEMTFCYYDFNKDR